MSRGRGGEIRQSHDCLVKLHPSTSSKDVHIPCVCMEAGVGVGGGIDGVWSSLQVTTPWPMHISGEGTEVRGGGGAEGIHSKCQQDVV